MDGTIAQTRVLMQKHYWLRRRNLSATICECLCPLFAGIMMVSIFWMIAGPSLDDKSGIADYDVQHIKSVHEFGQTQSGRTLLYAPASNPDVRAMMDPFPGSEGFETEEEMNLYFQQHSPFNTLAGIYFQPGATGIGNYSYTIHVDPQFLPATSSSQTSVDPQKSSAGTAYVQFNFLTVQQWVNEALIRLATGHAAGGDSSQSATSYLNFDFQRFPVAGGGENPKPDVLALLRYSVFRNVVGAVLSLTSIIMVYRLVAELTTEKELRLKETLSIMGMKAGPYWISSLANAFVCCVPGLLLCAVVVPGADVLPRANWFALFILLLFFCSAMVAFACLCSTLSESAKIVLAMVGAVTTESISTGGQVMLSFFAPTALSYATHTIVTMERDFIGLSFSNMHEPSESLSVSIVILMLFIDTWLYAFLSWYVSRVFPGSYGIAKPFCFCIQKNCGEPELSEAIAGDAKAPAEALEAKADVEADPHAGHTQPAVSIRGLRKVYDTNGVVALDNLTIDMYPDTLTSLLGHNGSGKSTLMSLLTGLLPPSSGHATIAHHSILTGMGSIRKQLGVCPQADVIWPSLTVHEHLYLICSLKGVTNPIEVEAQVKEMINDLQLWDKEHSLSGSLSGGQKRKLCVGMALIGGSSIVLLDECTSGMDPVNRRTVWSVLQKHKKGRTLLLSTHFLDEADILGDRIAILSKGVLRCAGSSLFLKSRFGLGYLLTLALKPEAEADITRRQQIISVIAKVEPLSSVVSNSGAELSFQLPRTTDFVKVLGLLEAPETAKALGILHFGLSLTTLEDVFLRLANESGTKPREPLMSLGRTHSERTLDVATSKPPPPSHLDADAGNNNLTPEHKTASAGAGGAEVSSAGHSAIDLDAKAPTASRTGNGGMVTINIGSKSADDTKYESPRHAAQAAAAPIVTLAPAQPAAAGGVRRNSNDHAKPLIDESHDASASSSMMNDTAAASAGLSVLRQIWATLIKLAISRTRDLGFFVFQVVVPIVVFIAAFEGKNGISNKLVSQPPLNLNTGAVQGMNQTVVPSDNLSPWSMAPPAASEAEAAARFLSYARGGVSGGGFPQFTDVYAALRNESALDTSRVAGGYIFHNVTNGFRYDATVMYNPLYAHALPLYFQQLASAAVAASTNGTKSLSAVYAPFVAGTFGQAVVDLFAHYVFGSLIALALAFYTATTISPIIKERESQLRYVQLSNGLTKTGYWIGTFLWDYLLYFVIVSAGAIIFKAYDFGFNSSDTGAGYAALLLFGVPGLLYAYCLSWNFKSHTTAMGTLTSAPFAMVVLLLPAVIAIALNLTPDAKPVTIINTVFSCILPLYNLAMAEMKVLDFVGLRYSVGLNSDASLYDLQLVGGHLWILFFQAIGGALALIVLETYDDVAAKVNQLTKQCCPDAKADGDDGDESKDDIRSNDEDVAQEHERMKAAAASPGSVVDSIFSLRLQKKFPADWEVSGFKTAVKQVSFGVPANECFGLLGHNGAGKTSLLRMLSCEVDPTKGVARIVGHDTVNDKRQAQLNMGLCPQFDYLVENMTPEEHLYYYARVKGIPSHLLSRTVEAFIQLTSLTPHRHKLSRELSGGNKRKLSLAIALIGNPSVLFLDEPSTGMDPGARRFVWSLIARLKAQRAIILTTHSMDEADALCTRLSIMRAGELVCLGSSQHLKSKFGRGYRLEIKVANGAALDRVIEFVRRTWPASQSLETNVDACRASWELVQPEVAPAAAGAVVPNNFSISQVFGLMKANQHELQIDDYSISQPTLEQIFLRLTAGDAEREVEQLKRAQQLEQEDEARSLTCCSLMIGYMWSCVAPFGAFGAHQFWLGNWGWGIVYVLTWNLLGVGIIWDWFTMPDQIRKSVRRFKGRQLTCCHCWTACKCCPKEKPAPSVSQHLPPSVAAAMAAPAIVAPPPSAANIRTVAPLPLTPAVAAPTPTPAAAASVPESKADSPAPAAIAAGPVAADVSIAVSSPVPAPTV